MSSSFGSAGSIGAGHDAYVLVVEPHVQIAIWALMAAVAVALVMIIVDMVKAQRAEGASLQAKAAAAKPARNRKAPPKDDE